MKKIVLILGAVFAMQTAMVAQITEGEVVFNAHLLSTFNLNVDGVDQEITFANAADYNNGVVEAVGVLPGITVISVEATEDWNLTIECPEFIGYAGPNGAGTGTIPPENLGVTITEDGDHGLATGEVIYTGGNPDPQGLTIAAAALISVGANSNAGDITDNAFTLHWQMGTMLGTMETTSMFDQMANGDFSTGDFTTTATLTLVPAP